MGSGVVKGERRNTVVEIAKCQEFRWHRLWLSPYW